jgi:hypothetical protein
MQKCLPSLIKVNLPLCLTNYALLHEGLWGSGCIDPHFLHLGTTWRWVIIFMPLPLYPRTKSPRYPLDRRDATSSTTNPTCQTRVRTRVAAVGRQQFLDREDEGAIVFRNVRLSPNCTELQLRIPDCLSAPRMFQCPRLYSGYINAVVSLFTIYLTTLLSQWVIRYYV